MDLSINFIYLFETIAFMASTYIIFDAIGNQVYERMRLTPMALIELHTSAILVSYAVTAYTDESVKFLDAFKRAGLSNDSTRKRKLLVERLGLSASYASARFALYQAQWTHGHHGFLSLQEGIHTIYGHLKNVYMKMEEMTQQDAKQRIIDEASMAIAELDFEDKIPFNTSLQNPALSFFRQTAILDKDRQP